MTKRHAKPTAARPVPHVFTCCKCGHRGTAATFQSADPSDDPRAVICTECVEAIQADGYADDE